MTQRPPYIPPDSPALHPWQVGRHMTPGEVDPSAWAWNPQGTLPKAEVPWPQAHWQTQNQTISFRTPGLIDGGAVHILSGTFPTARGVWASPIFDLKPKLEASSGNLSPGVSVVNPSGLNVELTYGGGVIYNVYTCERVAAFDSASLRSVGPATAQTQVAGDFTQDNGTGLRTLANFVFVPPAGCRFWQVVIVLDRMSAASDEDQMIVNAMCV